jgi:hypothetical protein
MVHRRIPSLLLLLASALLSGCAASSSIQGGPPGPPAPATASVPEARRWVLIRNLRYGATMAEPEYVWVPDDRIPTSATTLLFGKPAVLAPAEIIPRYAPPPEGGTISPLQGGPPPE